MKYRFAFKIFEVKANKAEVVEKLEYIEKIYVLDKIDEIISKKN